MLVSALAFIACCVGVKRLFCGRLWCAGAGVCAGELAFMVGVVVFALAFIACCAGVNGAFSAG